MGVDFNSFKNLSSQRRVEELRKLVDQLRQEIGDREKDIQTAEHLLALSQDEVRKMEQVAVPEVTPPKKKTPHIEEITEERLLPEEATELEKMLATAPKREELFHEMAHRPAVELYSELHRVYDRGKQTGVETQLDRDMVYAIRRGLEEKKKDMEGGQYSPESQAKHLLTAAEQMADGMYHSGAGSYHRGR